MSLFCLFWHIRVLAESPLGIQWNREMPGLPRPLHLASSEATTSHSFPYVCTAQILIECWTEKVVLLPAKYLGENKFLVENFLPCSVHHEEKQRNVFTKRLTKCYMYVYPHTLWISLGQKAVFHQIHFNAKFPASYSCVSTLPHHWYSWSFVKNASIKPLMFLTRRVWTVRGTPQK